MESLQKVPVAARVPHELKQKLEQEAIKNGMKLSEYVCELLEDTQCGIPQKDTELEKELTDAQEDNLLLQEMSRQDKIKIAKLEEQNKELQRQISTTNDKEHEALSISNTTLEYEKEALTDELKEAKEKIRELEKGKLNAEANYMSENENVCILEERLDEFRQTLYEIMHGEFVEIDELDDYGVPSLPEMLTNIKEEMRDAKEYIIDKLDFDDDDYNPHELTPVELAKKLVEQIYIADDKITKKEAEMRKIADNVQKEAKTKLMRVIDYFMSLLWNKDIKYAKNALIASENPQYKFTYKDITKI